MKWLEAPEQACLSVKHFANWIDENKTKQYEYLKKAKYFEIRAELEAGEITLEEAQKMWQKELNKLKKREGK